MRFFGSVPSRASCRDGRLFFGEMFHEKGCRLEKKTNYGQTKWIVQRNDCFLKESKKT